MRLNKPSGKRLILLILLIVMAILTGFYIAKFQLAPIPLDTYSELGSGVLSLQLQVCLN